MLQQSKTEQEEIQQHMGGGKRRQLYGTDQSSDDVDVRQYLGYGSANPDFSEEFDATLLKEPMMELGQSPEGIPFTSALSSLVVSMGEPMGESHIQGNQSTACDLSGILAQVRIFAIRQNHSTWTDQSC
jgi:hypothetical protein